MAQTLPKEFFHHVGRAIPLTKNGQRHLSEAHALRLVNKERKNRSRCLGTGLNAEAEAVDFIQTCFDQNWLCWICTRPIDPSISYSDETISVEHDPALSVARRHTKDTVKAAHVSCNHQKAAKSDTPRAAKIVRVRADEKEHRERMKLKAAGKALPPGTIKSRKTNWPKRKLRNAATGRKKDADTKLS